MSSHEFLPINCVFKFLPCIYVLSSVVMFSFLCRLRASRVLLIGVRGLGAEVAKNIVLAGIKSLCLLDHTQVAL